MEKLYPDAGVIVLALSPIQQPSGFIVMARQPTVEGSVLYVMDADRFEGTAFEEIEKRIVTVHGSLEYRKCKIQGTVIDETWASDRTRIALYPHHIAVTPLMISGARSKPAPREGIENLRKLDLLEIIARLVQQDRIRIIETIPHREEITEQLKNLGYKPDKKLATAPVDPDEAEQLLDSEMATALALSAWYLTVKSPERRIGHENRSHVETRRYNPLSREYR